MGNSTDALFGMAAGETQRRRHYAGMSARLIGSADR